MTVTAISQSAGRIQSAIASAAQATGVDFTYLLGQAKLESGLNTNARAGTSSATGLYQFIDQSWLGVVKKHGAEHGLAWAADAIHSSGGRYTVGDSATRQAILALRKDPEVASLMAAEHASDNKDALEGALGRDANGTDLYMAHFLGLGGARKFLKGMAASPQATGAALFPAAARANRSIFYASDGSPRTLAQIYDRFSTKLGTATAAITSDSAGTAAANLAAQFSQALAVDGDNTVVTGAGESATDALGWARNTLGALKGQSTTTASVLRPTPDTARLAYMMLARIGG